MIGRLASPQAQLLLKALLKLATPQPEPAPGSVPLQPGAPPRGLVRPFSSSPEALSKRTHRQCNHTEFLSKPALVQ